MMRFAILLGIIAIAVLIVVVLSAKQDFEADGY